MKLRILKSISLSALILPSIVGCSNNSSDESCYYTLSTAYSTQKVIQQTNKNDRLDYTDHTVKIQMMRDEYESGQLIITSNKKQTFDLIKTELVDKDTNKKIPLENIDIYVQKYIELETIKHTTGDFNYFESGEKVPDMLLPLEYAKNAKENVVDKDCNQGLTIEISSYGLEAGHYTGNFTLKIDGGEEFIPIDVTIWDFALEGKSNIQSCWLIYSMYMLTGEYDASRSMINTYGEFLSKYKANPYIIQEKSMNSPEAFMQDVKQFWKIKNYNSIIIPYDFPLDYTVYDDNGKATSEGKLAASYIVKLAEESTEEDFYLDYTLFYPSTYDEADAFPLKKEAAPAFFEKGGNYDKTLLLAIDMLEEKGYFAKHDEEWNTRVKEAIKNIPDVFTNCNFAQDWVEQYPATFCPQINVINNQKSYEAYMDYAEKNANGDFWTYTCLSPKYPYSSNHIDDENLSMRVMGWIEKAYNVNGYLFFMANMYTTEHYNNEYNTPYDVADRNGGANGDGFIMYPGRLYGSPTPFPSTRLVTYRDGLEDYDMLDVYNQKIQEMCKKYSISGLNFKDYVSDLYASLFTGTVPTREDELLFKAREELANRILSFDNEDDLFTNVRNDNGHMNLYVYANKPTLTIKGSEQNGEVISEGRYKYVVSLGSMAETIAIKAGNNEYKYENKGFKNATQFASSTSNVAVSKDSSFTYGDNSVKVDIVSYPGKTEGETARIHPKVTFKNLDLKNAKKIKFIYTNLSTENSILFDVELSTGTRDYVVGGHYCAPGVTKEVEINISNVDFDLSTITEMNLSFENAYRNARKELCLYDVRPIDIKDVIVIY